MTPIETIESRLKQIGPANHSIFSALELLAEIITEQDVRIRQLERELYETEYEMIQKKLHKRVSSKG